MVCAEFEVRPPLGSVLKKLLNISAARIIRIRPPTAIAIVALPIVFGVVPESRIDFSVAIYPPFNDYRATRVPTFRIGI